MQNVKRKINICCAHQIDGIAQTTEPKEFAMLKRPFCGPVERIRILDQPNDIDLTIFINISTTNY